MLSHAVIKRKVKTRSSQIKEGESAQSKVDDEWIPIGDLIREVANKRNLKGSLSHLLGNKGGRRGEENASGL